MFLLEVFDNGKWSPINSTLSDSKKELEKELEEMNTHIKKEDLKFLPVKCKYRIKKVKGKL